MQTTQTEVDEQQKAKRVQQKIKLMMKYKKMQKLSSDKDLASEKPMSTFNDKASSKFDQISIKNKKDNFGQQNYREQQTFETYSTKRIKSIIENDDMAPSSSINLKDQGKKFLLSGKEKRGLDETNMMKKVPSEQKIDKGDGTNRESTKKLKRPSSVINKSTRATTSRTRKQKPLEPEDQKAMQDKIRQIIPGCFEHGIKLQKYADQKRIDLNKEHEILLSEQLNIIRLINNSRKYYVQKAENEEQQDSKLSSGVQKEIIEMLKKKLEKETVINKCSQITDQITKLIDARLSALNKTKFNNA